MSGEGDRAVAKPLTEEQLIYGYRNITEDRMVTIRVRGARWVAFRGSDPIGPDPDRLYGSGPTELAALENLIDLET